MNKVQSDHVTAQAFSTSWNNLPSKSIYTWDEFKDWFIPLAEQDMHGRTVLEMGCGNGSLMQHLLAWHPNHLHGIDLGDSVHSARENLNRTGYDYWSVEQADLIAYRSEGFDLVYCIGVLHHLQEPEAGFRAVLENVVPGGRFHCWVYAKEGNWFVIRFVDPIRRIASRVPWWINKYIVATPLALLFYSYAKFVVKARPHEVFSKLPMYRYCQWISKGGLGFFRHVVFDQLVTPRTEYLERGTIESWLQDARIDPATIYILMRNGNSWKFGGQIL